MEIGVSLQTPDRVRRLQKTLYVKAKKEPVYRFYLLYDKVCRDDILAHAYHVSRDTRDEGRPLGLGLQGQGPNHRKRRWGNSQGRERFGKGGTYPSGACWEDERE